MSSSTANADFINVANWQGVDDEPIARSANLVESGGVNRFVATVNSMDKAEYSINSFDVTVKNKYILGADGYISMSENSSYTLVYTNKIIRQGSILSLTANCISDSHLFAIGICNDAITDANITTVNCTILLYKNYASGNMAEKIIIPIDGYIVYYRNATYWKNVVPTVFSGHKDISILDVSEWNNALYNTLSDAIISIPEPLQKGGINIGFKHLIPAIYTVVKTEGTTEQPAGTEIQEALTLESGTYTAAQMSGVEPPVSGSITYYLQVTEDNVTTYTTWDITKATSDTSDYVQCRLKNTEWSTNVSDWLSNEEEGQLTHKNNYLKYDSFEESGHPYVLKRYANINSNGIITTAGGNNYLMLIKNTFKKGDIIHFNGSSSVDTGVKFAFSTEDLTELDTVIGKPLIPSKAGFNVYYLGTSHDYDFVVPKDNLYLVIYYYASNWSTRQWAVYTNVIGTIYDINNKLDGSFCENTIRDLLHKQILYSVDSKNSIFGDNTVEHYMSCKKRCNFPRIQKADFRLTTDGKLFAHHDASITYQGEEFVFSEHTLQECLEAYRPQVYGEYAHPCDLEKFIIICKRDGLIPLITFRNENYEGTAQEIARVLKKYNMETSAIINSYPYRIKTIQAIRRFLPYTYIRCTTTYDEFFTVSQMEEMASYGNIIFYLWMSENVFESDLSKIEWIKSHNYLWWGSSNIGADNLEKYGSVVQDNSIAPISHEYHISVNIENGVISNIPTVAYMSKPEWSADFELSQNNKELYISNIHANNDSEISDRIPNSWIAEFPAKIECDKEVACSIDKVNYRFVISSDNSIQNGRYNIIISI